mmetsp:Transcript_36309/g.66469  ORF Transcript_36309/g.66469 Transcript_36309/m.66469 type:complete len:274 (+) Transcript_36309:77-898(+)
MTGGYPFLATLLGLFVSPLNAFSLPKSTPPQQRWRTTMQETPSRNSQVYPGCSQNRLGGWRGRTASVQQVIGSTAREVVSVSVAIALLWRRDIRSFLWVAGGVANAALSKVLKRAINEARPEGARPVDPGMPSSHAMSLFYQAAFLSCAAADSSNDWAKLFLPVLPTSFAAVSTTTTTAMRAAAAVGLISYASQASIWRIQAGYHTVQQILAGVTFGCLTGTAWYSLLRVVSERALFDASRKMSLVTTLGLLLVGLAAVGWRGIMKAPKTQRT